MFVDFSATIHLFVNHEFIIYVLLFFFKRLFHEHFVVDMLTTSVVSRTLLETMIGKF